ncbi:hypothetical protein QBC44DRAFT_364057 [Cladorrhinum sp. PSN332]|nr:hypothetical protein QBC44DRAFT_364057 [Cladorrhinum sp. PSN332]
MAGAVPGDLPNCTDVHLELDPDIAGLGVTIAFISSAVITVIAVVFGYLSGTLCNEYMNPFDQAVIKATKAGVTNFSQGLKAVLGPPMEWVVKPTLAWLSANVLRSSESVKVKMRQLFPLLGKQAPAAAPLPPGNELTAREEALTQFILTLSDQQLVTGMAILIAGIMNRPSLNVLDFRILFRLAWFSSTTHLATLGALRKYFRTHRTLRNIRVALILAVLVLLVYCGMARNYYPPGPSNPECLRTGNSGGGLQKSSLVPADDGFLGYSSLATSLLLVAAGYCGQIWSLYHEGGFLILLPQQNTSVDKYALPADEYLAVGLAMQRAWPLRKLKEIPVLPPNAGWTARLSSIRDKGWIAWILPSGMFLSSLSNLAFSLAFGISGVISWRQLSQGSSTGSSNAEKMGFGQLMAIFLLLLPFLAAGESWNDYRRSRLLMTTEQGYYNGHGQMASATDNLNLPSEITAESDSSAVRAAYEHHRNDMAELLAWQVYHIRDFEATRAPVGAREAAKLASLMKDALLEYQGLKDCEHNIPTLQVFVSLGMRVALYAFYGAMARSGTMVLVGLTILCFYAIDLSWQISATRTLRKRFCARNDTSDRLHQVQHPNDQVYAGENESTARLLTRVTWN